MARIEENRKRHNGRFPIENIGLQLCVRLRVFLSEVPFLHEMWRSAPCKKVVYHKVVQAGRCKCDQNAIQ